MKLIVCLDDKNGMLFNHRRQSRDQNVTADILAMTAGSRLYINAYSAPLFEGQAVTVAEDMLSLANEEDYCFVENLHVAEYADRIQEVILYKWNRRYPGDFFFDLDITDPAQWRLSSAVEFAGNSHETITKERYIYADKN